MLGKRSKRLKRASQSSVACPVYMLNRHIPVNVVEARSEICGVEYAKHANYAKQAKQASGGYQLCSYFPILRMKPRCDTSERIKCLEIFPFSVFWDFALCLGLGCGRMGFLLWSRIGSKGCCLTFWNADAKSEWKSVSAMGGCGECGWRWAGHVGRLLKIGAERAITLWDFRASLTTLSRSWCAWAWFPSRRGSRHRFERYECEYVGAKISTADTIRHLLPLGKPELLAVFLDVSSPDHHHTIVEICLVRSQNESVSGVSNIWWLLTLVAVVEVMSRI